MAKRKKPEVVKDSEFKPEIMMGMDYYSHVAIGMRRTEAMVSFVRISADGLEQYALSYDNFVKEFYRDLVDEEWSAITKFLKIALRTAGNDHLALSILEGMIEMKLSELKDKTMEELIAMHNEMAVAKGQQPVEKFKSLETARVAVVKLSKGATVKAKTKEAKKSTGKGVAGRPRTGVGAFAKETILKGGSNAEVLEKVKAKFPGNATTLSCIAYYRNALVKGGLLESQRKDKGAKTNGKNTKPVKGKSKKAEKKAKPASSEPAAA